MPRPTRKLLSRSLIMAVAALVLAAGQADARAGRGGGFGSRGARTWSPPPATTTAPRQAAPIQRSTQQPAAAAQRPLGQQARPGFFSTRGGFMGGLIGAGLIGMFLGYGLMGGLGGLGSILGLLLQVALVVFLARLAFRFFQRRMQPAVAGGPLPAGAGTLHREATARPTAGGGGGASGHAGAAPGRGRDQVGINQADLNGFERLLGEVQAAYDAGDAGRLRAVATPEAASFLADELDENARRGVANRITDVKLVQGDLAESWREGPVEYATVAMRFAHRDWTVERDSGRVVEGDPDREVEATEVWTFRRERGGDWVLSAIQAA